MWRTRWSGGLVWRASVLAGTTWETNSRVGTLESVAETSVRTTAISAARVCPGTLLHAAAKVEVVAGIHAMLRAASVAELVTEASGILFLRTPTVLTLHPRHAQTVLVL